MRHSPSRRRGGFTFLEILVVFIVFSAAAAISIRSVGDTVRRNRLAKAAAVISADFEQAFAIAARQRLPVRVLVDTVYANRKVTVVDRNTPTLIYKTRSFKKGEAFEVDSIWTTKGSFDIMPNGIATDEINLTFMIRTTGGAQYTKTVRTSKGGLVRVGNQ